MDVTPSDSSSSAHQSQAPTSSSSSTIATPHTKDGDTNSTNTESTISFSSILSTSGITKNFPCCGLIHPTFDDLLKHYEVVHQGIGDYTTSTSSSLGGTGGSNTPFSMSLSMSFGMPSHLANQQRNSAVGKKIGVPGLDEDDEDNLEEEEEDEESDVEQNGGMGVHMRGPNNNNRRAMRKGASRIGSLEEEDEEELDGVGDGYFRKGADTSKAIPMDIFPGTGNLNIKRPSPGPTVNNISTQKHAADGNSRDTDPVNSQLPSGSTATAATATNSKAQMFPQGSSSNLDVNLSLLLSQQHGSVANDTNISQSPTTSEVITTVANGTTSTHTQAQAKAIRQSEDMARGKRTLSVAAFSLGSYTGADLKRFREGWNLSGVDLAGLLSSSLSGDKATTTGNSNSTATTAANTISAPATHSTTQASTATNTSNNAITTTSTDVDTASLEAQLALLAQPVDVNALTPEMHLQQLLQAHYLVQLAHAKQAGVPLNAYGGNMMATDMGAAGNMGFNNAMNGNISNAGFGLLNNFGNVGGGAAGFPAMGGMGLGNLGADMGNVGMGMDGLVMSMFGMSNIGNINLAGMPGLAGGGLGAFGAGAGGNVTSGEHKFCDVR
jgi:hypothetical protein